MSYQSLSSIEFTKFSSNFTEWVKIKDLFTSVVDRNTRISSVENLDYSKLCPTGEAAHLLRRIPITHDKYQRCWDLLKERFENNKLFIDVHLLKSLPFLR